MLGAKQRVWLLGLMLFWTTADQVVKAAVKGQMQLQQSIALWPDVFQLTFVYNKGAAFSLFERYPSLLTASTIILFFAILMIALRQRTLDKLSLAAYSLVLGGALGNILDRVLLGQVVDYLDFTLIHYPIFNLADSCIFVGVSILLFCQFKTPVKPLPQKSKPD